MNNEWILLKLIMIRNLTAFALMFLIGISAFGQVKIPADSLKKHVYYLADDSLEGRGLGTQSGLKVANYIADYFKQIGLKSAGENYLHPFYTRQGQTMLIGNNVVGIVEGSDPELKDEYIVLGAHFDHISYEFKNGEKIVYNGADDNATGTAAIIEIGRVLVQQKEKLKRSVVIVAFDGEESGLIGSREFVKQNIVPVENVKLMMSIDMIGRYAKSNSLIMGAMGSLKGGDEMLFEIAVKHGIEIKKTKNEISSRTDSKPFGQVGIPALHVTSGIIGPYHKPKDDAETIDYEGMEKISGLLYDLTVEIANSKSLEPIRELATQAKNGGLPFFRYGLKANVGSSYHSYPNEFFNGKSKFSSEVGLMTQLKITKNFSLQPEVLYSTLASDFNTGNFRTHSVTTPVSLVLATKMNKVYNLRLYVNVGGYYSYHFSGSANGKSLDFDNTFEQTETGLVYGFGMEVMSVFISVNFLHGLSNLMKDKNIGEFTNRATYFSMGYIF
ncbi:MAG: M28 family peptidase [Candidatus Hodarchaeales archaeon]